MIFSLLLLTGVASAMEMGLGSPSFDRRKASKYMGAFLDGSTTGIGREDTGVGAVAAGSAQGSSKAGMPRCLKVRTSKLPHAGNGLFATCDMKAGTSIGEYYGTVSEVVPPDSTYTWGAPLCRDASSVVHMTNRKEFQQCAVIGWHYIDAKDVPTSLLRFANSVRSPAMRGLLNLEVRFQGGEVFYDLVRDVHAGDELLIDYGESYWKGRGDENVITIALVMGGLVTVVMAGAVATMAVFVRAKNKQMGVSQS